MVDAPCPCFPKAESSLCTRTSILARSAFVRTDSQEGEQVDMGTAHEELEHQTKIKQYFVLLLLPLPEKAA